METPWLYLLLNAATLFIPFIRSFEPRVGYAQKWYRLFPAIALVGAFFLVWDIIFTARGYWGFNPLYLSGLSFFELPLGEWLFFFSVPFACVFIYEVLNYFFPKSQTIDRIAPFLNGALMAIMLVLLVIHYDKPYTFWNFLFNVIFLAFVQWKRFSWMGKFYRAYAVGLIGFFGVNGILTGTGVSEEVVWYNPEVFMGLRMGTIPLEDTFYGMLLIMMNVWLFEAFKKPNKR